MYPSGLWEGFWQQEGYGRQPMDAFQLHFVGGEVTGSGVDVISPFVFTGRYDEQTGAIQMTKQYQGARSHAVEYDGKPDGEGCIVGTWTVLWSSGPFLLRPALPKPTGDEPVHEIKPRR